jgi:hypothetical protein
MAEKAFDHVWFCDDIFGLKPGWVHEFDLTGKEIAFQIQNAEGLTCFYRKIIFLIWQEPAEYLDGCRGGSENLDDG